MTIAYPVKKGLYLNITNRCPCDCAFCLRKNADGVYGSDSLWLDHEPSFNEIIAALNKHNLADFSEIVFCGYGEPTCRLDDMLWICDRLHKELGDTCPPIRLNTNGHGSLINGRDVTPELAGRLDAVSVSFNGSNMEEYLRLTRPGSGEKAWQAMLDFVRDAGKYVPKVMVSIVDYDKSEAEIEACRQLAESLGAIFRVRPFA
jgi:TatD family-associated radical SAM protein